MAVLLATALVGCGGSGGEQVQAGAPDPSGSVPGANDSSTPGSSPSSTAPVPQTTTSDSGGVTTTVAPAGGSEGASPVDGLAPDDLRTVVEAPRRDRARRGPVADRVALADGRSAWRVTIPGEFPLRSARLTVSVGERDVGVGIATPDGGALVAVTLNGDGLVDGAEVTWGAPGAAPTEAGPLAVIR